MASVNGFWTTLDLLVGHEWRKPEKQFYEDIEDWLESVIDQTNAQSVQSTRASVDVPSPKSPVIATPAPPTAWFCLDDSSGYSSLHAEITSPRSDTSSLHVQPLVDCRFSLSRVRARLEHLMGSNVVRLTDRKYMQYLQQRIREDYVDCMKKRIHVREADERNREKRLVLSGRIPYNEAPETMYMHPVLVIDRYCQKLIAARRALIKIPKVIIPKLLYLDDSNEPETKDLTIPDGHHFNRKNNKLITETNHLQYSDEIDFERGYMITPQEFEKLQYENPLLKDLKNAETVAQMYELAEEILGPLKNFPIPVTTFVKPT